jgi:sugar phosphate isomerase/epimerase
VKNGTRISLGVSLFSFAAEFMRGLYTLEELLHEVAALRLGPGVELVGFQSLRGFPDVDERTVRRFRSVVDTLDLVPSCLGGSADIGRRSDREQTEDELVAFVRRQLEVARRLGFPALTIQATTPVDVVRQLVRHAEDLDVVLVLEIGAQLGVADATVARAWELIEEVDSGHLGFGLDFGSSTRALPASAIAAQRRRGMAPEALAIVEDAYARLHSGESDGATERRRLAEDLEPFADPEGLTFAWRTTMLFGHQPVEAWRQLVDRIVHVHAKAFEIDDDGEDPTIDAVSLLRVLWEGGYRGAVNCEWEGHLWVDHDDNIGPVVRQQQLLRRELERMEAKA